MYYFSYFGNVDRIKKERSDMVFVSISLWCRGWNGKRIKELAPSADILNEYKYGGGDWSRYEERFNREILGGRSAKKLDKLIKERWGDRDYCFCCYEKSNLYCHRRLVMEWMMRDGLECREY